MVSRSVYPFLHSSPVYPTHIHTHKPKTRDVCSDRPHLQAGPKKRGHRLMTIILSNLDRFTKIFTGRFIGKFAVQWILNIQPHLAYVATLPCETLMSAKQVIYDKLQGSVAIYLRCGEVFNNQIEKRLSLSLRVKKINR